MFSSRASVWFPGCTAQMRETRYEMEAYIREGVGITDEEVERLRQQLLD